MGRVLYILFMLLLVCQTAVGQKVGEPVWRLEMCGEASTNHNASVRLVDSVAIYVFDSLRKDGMATIVTVYETDEDSAVGLWEMGSGGNRALWLNTQSASYEDFHVRYRQENEKGVIVHTMTYAYPQEDSNYTGKDTLFVGREGEKQGEKNFCAMYYYQGLLPYRERRVLESALAVRYGALLHGPYIDREWDTLWDPTGKDSLYSVGVCGIGRDDSIGLWQKKSAIRGDILTIEQATELSSGTYVMMGFDGDGTWKLRAHGSTAAIRISLAKEEDGKRQGLLVATEDEVQMLMPGEWDSISLQADVEYYVTLLRDIDVSYATRGGNRGVQTDGRTITLSPNPTTGRFRVKLEEVDDELEVKVLDTHGRMVLNGALWNGQYEGVLEAEGVYYVVINGRTLKLIVMK